MPKLKPYILIITNFFIVFSKASSDLKFTMESDKEESMEHIAFISRGDSHDNNSTTTPTTPTSTSTILPNHNKFNPFKPQDMETAVTLFKHRWLHVTSSSTNGATAGGLSSLNSEENDYRDYIDDLGSAASFSKVCKLAGLVGITVLRYYGKRIESR